MAVDDHDAELAFRCMGCHMRVMVGARLDSGLPPPDAAARAARALLEGLDARLSRFKDDSELTALNGDPREEVPASPVLRAAIGAGLWAAEHSGGLVDPTLLDALERAGYRTTREGAAPASLAQALRAAPPRRPARGRPGAPWRAFDIDEAAGTIRRPAGLRFDTGGTGKGLAADAVAQRLAGYERFAVDCAGDLHVGGPAARQTPFRVEIPHPLDGGVASTLEVPTGAVATSALGSRLWATPDGGFAHHLLDPSRGEPAWTGLVSATALAASTLEAETLSKAALLSGPDGARRVLAVGGGVLVHDDGRVEAVGSAASPRVRLRLP